MHHISIYLPGCFRKCAIHVIQLHLTLGGYTFYFSVISVIAKLKPLQYRSCPAHPHTFAHRLKPGSFIFSTALNLNKQFEVASTPETGLLTLNYSKLTIHGINDLVCTHMEVLMSLTHESVRLVFLESFSITVTELTPLS